MYIGDLASIPVYLKSSPWLDKNINSRDGETVSIPKPVQPQQIPAIPPQTLTPPQQWKPEVKPVGQVPSKPTQPGQTFTKTSLEANIPVSTLYTCRRLMGSTDQACSSACFYFRIAWKSTKWPCFLQNHSISFLQDLRSLRKWLL